MTINTMPRTPAHITQADVARTIRAAKQAGAAEVELRIGDSVMVIRMAPSTALQPTALEPEGEIVL